jgi:TRAP-type C4-dicarboxylate transport system permease small subunit
MRLAIIKFISVISGLVEKTSIFLGGLLVVVVSANVVARYFFKISMKWAEELSLLLFVWLVFLGAFIALHRNLHLSIVLLVDRISPELKSYVHSLSTLLVLTLLSVITFGGALLVLRTVELGRITPILGISAAWGYLSVPVSSFLMLFEMIGRLLTPKFQKSLNAS